MVRPGETTGVVVHGGDEHPDGSRGQRTERDSLGPVSVDEGRLWGPQTQRAIANFNIGQPDYRWGRTVLWALGAVKSAAAGANRDEGVLNDETARLIEAAAEEVSVGDHDQEFPLAVFQAGSGTQTNMNANEVIANRANQLAGTPLGEPGPVHPNDHVNASQSSNDVFPTVMHLAVITDLRQRLYPALDEMTSRLHGLASEHADLAMVGRTHLQDATPVTFGQQIESWRAQVRDATANLRQLETTLRELAIGGTATGTGLNAPPGFAGRVAARLSDRIGIEFIETDNHFTATAAHDPMVNLSAGLRTLAGGLMKMANDIRFLSSGPRNGIGELVIPANEPGSSIMPGKVNPTQAEALNMVVARVFGNDATVAFAGTQSELQLNVYKPVILHSILDSINLLADTITSFTTNLLSGLEPDRDRIDRNLDINLMIVTALTPVIGYDRAAEIAQTADQRSLTISEVATEDGHLRAADANRLLDPLALAKPHETMPPAEETS